MRALIISLLCVFSFSSVAQGHRAIAAPDTFSSDVGMDVLQKGGNAVDAAIAVQFALAVTLPEAGNIGGGGFMVIHTDQGNDFIDYRETAPAAASRDMYLDKDGNVERLKSLFGIYASGRYRCWYVGST